MKSLFMLSAIIMFHNSILLADPSGPLKDIAPTTEDRQSDEEIESSQNLILQKFYHPRSQFLENHQYDRSKYNHIDPNDQVPTDLLIKALNFYDFYKNKFENQDYITIVDFSARSNFKRFFIVNMKTGQVYGVRTAHGSGGDLDNDGFVEKVSNITDSHMSSKGFYQVSEIYYGKYGRSIRLDGLSSTNSKVRSRAIVIHGSKYVKERNTIQGRSWGCFALSFEIKDWVIDHIAEGSLLYADFSQE